MTLSSGIISKIYGAYYEILPSNEDFKKIKSKQIITAKLRGKLRLENKHGNRHLLFIGDFIRYHTFQDEPEAIIEQIVPRRNSLFRSNKYNSHCLGANIDRAILTISLTNPQPKTGFIDRFLVSCHEAGVPPILLFTKLDLVGKAEQDLKKIIQTYEALGYDCFRANLLEPKDKSLNALKKTLKQGTTLMCGFSGTGKSTFINIILKQEIQKTASVSDGSGKGRHTTTNSTLFIHPNNNATLIDTPGVKEWGIEHLLPIDIWNGFPETSALHENCLFNDCLHEIKSKGCKIQELFLASRQAFEATSNLVPKDNKLIGSRRSSSLKKMIQGAISFQKNLIREKSGQKTPFAKKKFRKENKSSKN